MKCRRNITTPRGWMLVHSKFTILNFLYFVLFDRVGNLVKRMEWLAGHNTTQWSRPAELEPGLLDLESNKVTDLPGASLRRFVFFNQESLLVVAINMLHAKRGVFQRVEYFNILLKQYRLLKTFLYLHVALTNLPTTVCAGNSPVYTVILSVPLEMPSFHGFTTRWTLCVTILAAFLVSLVE